MTDRRRSLRYSFSVPQAAKARTICEALIEAWDDRAVVLRTAKAVAEGDTVIMRVLLPSGSLVTRAARVVSSSPVVGGHAMQFRLTVSLSPEDQGWPVDPVPKL